MIAHVKFLLLIIIVLPMAAYGQADVSVTPGEVVHVLKENPLGINMNTWMDDQANRPSGAQTMSAALAASGLHFLRFPGGEKSDGYMWATPPYTDPATATLIRRGPHEFPYAYPPIFDSLANTWTTDNYNFDEFMANCRAVGGEPVIAVAMDNIYKPAEPGGSTLSRAQTLELAVEWVRYANVTKKYGIKYWTLGNETWNPGGYNGAVPDFRTYGADVREFATAMKAVDSTILIGINADGYDEFDRALDSCAAVIDFLDVHNYPCFGFNSYTDYLRKDIGHSWIVEQAELAILYGNNAEERQHLFITLTETSAFGFVENSAWERGNNIGQALANFDLFAQLAADDRVRFSQYWNTHWIHEDAGLSYGSDLLTAENQLNASGRALALLSHGLLDEMVRTTSDGPVRTFATLRSDGGALTVFLLNKDTVTTPVELTLVDYLPRSRAGRSVFYGRDLTDTEPVYANLPDESLSGNLIDLELPATSVTVLRFGGEMETCAANHVAEGGFEQRTIDPWQAEAEGGGTAGRIEDATVNSGAGSGYVAEGDAKLKQLIPNLEPNSDYLLTANVMYFSDNPELPAVKLAVEEMGMPEFEESITTTGGEYRTVTLPFTTGPEDTSATIVFSVADARTYGWIDEVSVRCNTLSAALPVELLSFRGAEVSEGNHLEWTVTQERDLLRYIIESSPRARKWTQLATVVPSADDSPTKRYTFVDEAGGTRHYRLRMEDVDGSVSYSELIRIGTGAGGPASLFPNPTDGLVYLPATAKGREFRMTNARGRTVLQGTYSEGPLSLTGLPAGLYYIYLGDGEGYRVIKR